MFYINELQQSGIVWLMLIVSMVTAFIGSRFWLMPLAASLVLALLFGHLTVIGLFIIAAGGVVAYKHRSVPDNLKLLLQGFVIVWAVALAAHILPGFNNLLVLENVLAGANSLPFTLYLNIDKSLIFFGLLLLMPQMLKQPSYKSVSKLGSLSNPSYLTDKKALILMMSLAITIFLVATLCSLIEPELSLPSWWWVFFINNLFFTCVVEEAFFRGYLQTQLLKKLPTYLAILLSSILFGIAHFSGGLAYVFIATIAGVLYGFTYYYTGRLSLAIALHLTINMLHLVFFTYPIAR